MWLLQLQFFKHRQENKLLVKWKLEFRSKNSQRSKQQFCDMQKDGKKDSLKKKKKKKHRTSREQVTHSFSLDNKLYNVS